MHDVTTAIGATGDVSFLHVRAGCRPTSFGQRSSIANVWLSVAGKALPIWRSALRRVASPIVLSRSDIDRKSDLARNRRRWASLPIDARDAAIEN